MSKLVTLCRMTSTRLATLLLASGLALTAGLSAKPSNAALTADHIEYCTSPVVLMQNPNCTPVPTPSTDYRGEPIAVYNEKKVTTFETYVYVNVLKNDAIQRKSRAVIKITGQQPRATGVYAFVIDGKIRLRFERAQIGPMWSGAVIRYTVKDAKGRTSNETYLDITQKPL